MSCVFAGALPMVSRNLGHRGVAVFSIFCLIIAFLSSAFIWIDLYIGSSPVWLDLFGPWFEVGTVTVSWIFYYDLLTAHMLFTVTSVSLAVHIFAVVYMRSDPHLSLFMSYLSLFTFFMLVYVCGDNLLVMLVGWEGIGVCSYLLIGYYSHRLAAVKSAQKAILVNRVSDGMLLWGVLWIWYYTGSLEYDLVLLNQTSSISMFIVISVLIGAMGKSAQILFHVWLADAMEGPTPVSALIHAATLVTAGIYLMVRLGPFMAGSDLVILVGCSTAFMAGVFGFFQSDLKRVIAFSTCSQLGYATQYMIIKTLGTSLHIQGQGRSFLFCNEDYTKGAIFIARKEKCGNSWEKDVIPDSYIEKFDDLSKEQQYLIKSKYKNKSVVYLWQNKINGLKKKKKPDLP
jgi:NADH:ubiquinone oxidoreductase subunit 5 (subunit L)/multisubunit Na+/H+ antiporter MnhA subunit